MLRIKKHMLDFGERHKSIVQRNSMIAEGMPRPNSWVLDVGSNTGATGNYLSERGHIVVGVEKMENEYRESLRRAHHQAAFICHGVTPDFILNAPDWHSILLLSVLHRLYAFEGEAFMRDVLLACSKKTDNLFIEGSTRHARYVDQKEIAPAFEDLDIPSANAWHQDLFKSVLGPEWNVPDGKPLACSEAEPFRLFYHLRRAQS